MRAKRIVAIVVLVVIAFLIAFPPLSSGGVKVSSSSTSSPAAAHVYVTIGEISAHRADTVETSGWFSISNISTDIDLALVNSTVTIALGSLPLGEYDTIRVTLANATVVINDMSKKVQLESTVFKIPTSFLVRFGAETSITLKITPELQTAPDTTTLKLSFAALPSEAP